MKTFIFDKRSVYGFVVTLMLVAVVTTASAATRTWSGIGVDGNWQTVGNWDTVPVGGDVLTFTGLNQLANTNNFLDGTQFNGLVFDANAGAFVLDGNAIKLAGPITNVSANAQVINLAFTNTTAAFTVHCETNVTLNGRLTGGATLTKSGLGRLVLNNSGIALNQLILDEGVIDLAADLTFGTLNGGNTTINGKGGTIASSGGKILLNGGANANGPDWHGGSTTPIIIEAPIVDGPSAYDSIDYYNAGDLILRGANTYTGLTGFYGTRVQIGVDSVGTVGALVSGPFGTGPLRFENGYMSADSSTPRTILNAVNFTGNMILGNTNLNGKLTFSSDINLGNAARMVTADSEVQFDGALTNGGFVKAGSATVTLAGANTYAMGTTISSNRLIITGSILDTGAFTLNGPTAITTVDTALKVGALTLTDGTIDGSGFVTGTSYTVSSGLISPNLGGNAALTKTGAGTVTLAGANTYAGGTTISAGRLIITGSILDTGAFTLNGPTAITTVDTALKVGALTLTDGTIDGSGFVTGTSYTVSSGLISANLGGDATLTKTGAGTVTLSGANTYTATVVNANAGILLHAKTSALYNGDTGSWTKEKINVASGGTLAFNVGGPGEFTLADIATLRDNLTVDINTNGLRGGARIGFDTSNAVGANFDLTESIGNSTGLGAGTLGLTKLGTNTLTLAVANTYTGETTVNNGVLKVNLANALTTSTTLTAAGTGTFDLNGYSFTVANLGVGATGGTITDNAAGTGTSTLTVTNFTTAGMYARLADGPTRVLALTVANPNSGPIFGNNANTFSGGLKLKYISGDGTRLVLNANPVNTGTAGAIVSSPFGRGTITIGEAATDKAQIYYTAANGTILNDIVFNTMLGTDRTAAFRLDSTLTLAGTLTANLAPVSLAAYATATGGQKAYLTGRITGPGVNGGLRLKDDNATYGEVVTLNNQTGNPNDYAGYTWIESRNTLALGADEQIPHGTGKGDVYVYGKLNLNGYTETINGLFGTGTVDGGGTTTLKIGENNVSSSFLGVITNSSGALTVFKTGSGTMSLEAPLRISGAVVVENGTLLLPYRPPVASTPVAGMARWFDASSSAYVTTNAAGKVTQWNDLSGNNAHAVNATGTRLPLYAENTLNGKPTVKFDSAYNDTGEYLKFTRDIAIRTVFSVFKGESFLLTDYSAYNFHRPTDNDATSPLWTGYTADSIELTGMTYVNAASVNGSTYRMPTGANNGFNLVSVFASGSVIADGFNKDRTSHSGKQSHAEVLIYDRALSEAERAQVEGYLMSKWLKDPFIPTSTTLTVLSGGVLDLNGHSQEVATLKGNGAVSNGTLVVANAIDLTNEVASAFAVNGSLTMKPGAELRVDRTVSASDVVNVSDTLKIEGANTVLLKTFGGALPPFRVTLFTFETLDGPENLSSWTVELPPELQNYETRFHGENNQVYVNVFMAGTVIQLK